MNEVTKAPNTQAAPDEPNQDQIREFLKTIEGELSKAEQIDIPIEHYFSKAVYAREMKMPKGSLVIGKIHKHKNLNILSAGEVSVLSIDGIVRVKAPHTFVASPGAKRMIFAHEDVVWTTIHGTELTEVSEIEQEFIAKSYDEVAEANAIAISEVKEIACPG